MTMVAAAQDSVDQPANIVEERIEKEDEDHVAVLIESVQKRIQEDNEQFPEAQSVSSFWERKVDASHVAEAIRVSDSMLGDTDHLNRILVARKFRIEKATDLFFEQVRFRAEWRPSEITPDLIPNALPSGAWRLCGYSREGCVVSNYKLEYWNPDEYEKEDGKGLEDACAEYTRYILYMIELMMRNRKPEPVSQQFVVLFDLTGFSTRLVFRSNVRLMIENLIYVAQAQYPELLHKVLLVNAPYGFSTAWKLITLLLDEKTASKIHFVTPEQILDDIAPEVLSTEYGGSHPEYPILPDTLDQAEEEPIDN